MKLFLIVFSAFISLTTALEGRFETPLDHFRTQDGRTVRFNYDVNIEHYVENGTLFFYISDAGQYTTEWIERGLIADLAMEFGAALFTADIRYFRNNTPTETVALDDLEFLSVEQVLRDIAIFIDTARRHLNNYSGRVFVWGSGIGGTLAILARQRFPSFIDGAWSSNGIFMPTVFATCKKKR
ncbi:putative serine protease pcp-1 [Pseudolycoriella hygida]|uniref:Serine protease pcp-1 n=1 Tax=Pseudolycoriella hygida TaxID=35572 RepID=A0A9Q0N0F3_9DIPT|nr:putative serine protease pcp-1 [Pseudolycoriella hygida]